jgi:phage/plasmid-like protein (TIGR03299 family)
MPADLSLREDGTAEMMFNAQGGEPWHGMGEPIEGLFTVDRARTVWPWHVDASPVLAEGREVAGYKALIRSDSRVPLSIVGDKYVPIHPAEVADLAEALAGEGGVVDTVGTLGDGQRIWMLCKVPGDLIIDGADDKVHQYLLIYNGNDGRLSFGAKFTPVRVVCSNTLSAAGVGRGTKATGEVKLRHTRNVKDRVAEARRILGLATKRYADLAETFRALLDAKVEDDAVADYFKWLIPDNDAAKSKTRTENIRADLAGAYRLAPGAMPGRAWGAYGAATYWASHRRVNRVAEGGDRAQVRMESMLWGSGADFGDRALRGAMALAGMPGASLS